MTTTTVPSGDGAGAVSAVDPAGATPSGETGAPAPTAAADIASGARVEWAEKIRTAWNKSLQGIIETGQRMIEAKAALPHGEFEAMVENDLPFGSRAARMFRAIASDNRITNRNHGSVLPPSWRTLYELTRLPDDRFHEMIEDGTIHPEMQRKDASAKNRKNGSPEMPMPLVPLNGNVGPKVNLPNGKTVEQIAREGIVLQDNGATIKMAADALGIIPSTFWKIRDVVKTADRTDLSPTHKKIADAALVVMNTTRQPGGGHEMVKPIIKIIWGSKRNSRSDAVEHKRHAAFDKLMGSITGLCAVMNEADIPYLGDDLPRIIKEIKTCERELKSARKRIEELFK